MCLCIPAYGHELALYGHKQADIAVVEHCALLNL